jgi:hypothetical protein
MSLDRLQRSLIALGKRRLFCETVSLNLITPESARQGTEHVMWEELSCFDKYLKSAKRICTEIHVKVTYLVLATHCL